MTVSATGDADNQASGGSLKIIADTEDWDNSVGLNTPGQSGDPDSPHYRDLFELWAQGQYFPVAYSRKKVESVTESVTAADAAATSTQHSSVTRPESRRHTRSAKSRQVGLVIFVISVFVDLRSCTP